MTGEETDALPPETAVGRVALHVDDVDSLVPFYRDVVGCRVERDGDRARLTAADRTLLVLEAAPDAPPRPPDAAGLFHVAVRLPDRPSLGDALHRVRESEATLSGASDHLVSEALYLRDPGGNGVELYRDRPRDRWTRRADGRAAMDTLPLDLDDLAAAASGATGGALPEGTDVGHVHLEVADLDRAVGFYVDGLGLRPSSDDYAGARFLAAGDYHHHVALNTWNRRSAPAGAHQGLGWFELTLPDDAALDAVEDRLERRGAEVRGADGTTAVADPDGIEVRLRAG